jgi:tetratricopeptide (TPR) repeat protein
MNLLYGVFLGLTIIFLSACQTVEHTQLGSAEVFHDDVFADYAGYSIESEAQIFALNDQALAFIKQSLKGQFKPQDKIESLVEHIFSRSKFNLLYRAEANTTASETFDMGAANCLSMSIMTYALAKKAGFGVRFQDIEIPEYWTRREGQSLVNRHINLQILPRPEMIRGLRRGFEVDFDAQVSREHLPRTFISLQQVVAMYYNNKGADALLKGQYDKAYAYFKAAINQEPTLSSGLANLGYLYRLNGYDQFAEDAYLRAIDVDQDNLAAWGNLAYLYRHSERLVEAEQISARLNRKRVDNPFFHINLGDRAFDNRHWPQALQHYRRALKLDKYYHEVFFGLAKTYHALGDIARSKRYFKLAKKKSRTQQEEDNYQGKLALLNGL